MFGWLKEVFQRRELLLILVVRNLKIRYKNSALGFFWSLLSPLFLILIYAVFLRVMRFAWDLPVLVTGIIVWQFLALCLGDSLHAVVGNANLVTKASFPRIILPLAMTGANLVNFLLSFAVLCVYLVVVRVDAGAVLWLPLILLTQFALCFGVALIISCANVFFRDTEHILSVVMLAWFFLTPVIYPIEIVFESPSLPWWTPIAYHLNPMTGIVTAYRAVLLSSPLPGSGLLPLSFCVAWAVPLVGFFLFQRLEGRFGDEL